MHSLFMLSTYLTMCIASKHKRRDKGEDEMAEREKTAGFTCTTLFSIFGGALDIWLTYALKIYRGQRNARLQ